MEMSTDLAHEIFVSARWLQLRYYPRLIESSEFLGGPNRQSSETDSKLDDMLVSLSLEHIHFLLIFLKTVQIPPAKRISILISLSINGSLRNTKRPSIPPTPLRSPTNLVAHVTHQNVRRELPRNPGCL